MSGQGEKITDKKMIFEIFRSRFINKKLFMKTPEASIQIDSFGIEEGFIAVRGLNLEIIPKNTIFFIRDNEEVIYSNAVYREKNRDGEHLFEPVNIQILHLPRKEERKSVKTGKKEVVYISNIVSDFKITESLQFEHKRVDSLKDLLLEKIRQKFPDSDLFFLHDKSNDPRMQFFATERKPLFIRDISDLDDNDTVKKSKELRYYREEILPKEIYNSRQRFVSEVSVPLLYKLMMPFGYVKIRSGQGLNDNDFSAIKKFGMSVSTVFTNDKKLIATSNDRIAVTDLSMSGLAVLFKERVMIKHFKEKSIILFTLFLPDNRQTTMLCSIKNIAIIANNVYRVGCEIENIEAIGEVNLSEYLESI